MLTGVFCFKCSGWKGHKWAEPDENHLKELLRDVHSDPETARKKGVAARARMVSEYSFIKIRGIVSRELSRIVNIHNSESLSEDEL